MINKTLRRLAVGASAITVLGVVVPLAAATSASAATAPSGVTATPSTQTVAGGTPAVYSATLTPAGSTSANGVDYVVSNGPAGSALLGGTAACTPAGAGPGPFSCSVTTAAADTPGTYTVTIFDDAAGTGVLAPADARTTVQLVISGAANNTTITPTTSTIATATCQVYTVTGTDINGNPATGADPISITQTTNSPAPGTDPNLRFCNPAVTTFPAPAVGAKAPVTAGTSTYTEASTVTLVNGTGKFGVASDYPGTVAVTAGTNSVGGSGATATLTVDAGNTTAGPSTANNDVASSLTVSPTPTKTIAGATVTETVTVKNASGDLLGGVQVSDIVTGANPAAEAPCGVTDQTGTVTCTYTATNNGTDTLTAFVEQDKNGANNKPGPNTGEPQASATITVAAALTAATLGSSCPGDTPGVAALAGTGGTCNAPASQASQTVTFTLTSTVGGTSTPAAGQTLTISETSNTVGGVANKAYTLSSPGATVNTNGTLTATTDANGQVAVTVTHTAGTAENGTVTATFANGGTNISDTSAVDFVTPTATTVTITPAAQTKAVASTVTATITVTDQLGKPVGAGTNVNYTTGGANSTTPGANGTCTTDANGQCTITYTDKGPAESGAGNRTDTITATVVGVPGATGSATVTFVSGTATASNVTLATSSGTATVTTDPATGKTAPVTTLTATVQDANGNPLYNDAVTFTSAGVGVFTDKTGHPTGSSTFTTTTQKVTVGGVSTAVATAYVRSTTPGTQTVTATADGVASNQVTVTYTNSQFTPVTPERLVDTRTNQGGLAATSGPLAPNTAYTFNLASTDVPTGEAAYVFNVTAVHPSGAGNLRIGPACAGVPTTSLINYQANSDIANDVVVPNQPLGGGGACDSFTIYSAGSATNVVIDLQGYYGSAAGFTGGTPTRAVDTRSGQGGHTGTIAANTSASFTIAGVGGVPAVGSGTPAKAVAINVTAIGPGGVGNLRIYPDGAKVPTTSNINYVPGTDKAAFVVVQLPANGKIDVYSAGSAANVAIDVFGYYPSTSTVVTQTPVRVFDSRSGTGLKAGVPVDVPVTTPGATNGVPAGAQAVLISLTAIHAKSSTGIGNLRAYPTGTATPTVSNINYISSTTDVANFAIVPIGANGKITLYSAGSDIDATVDILGYVPATG